MGCRHHYEFPETLRTFVVVVVVVQIIYALKLLHIWNLKATTKARKLKVKASNTSLAALIVYIGFLDH